MAAYAWTPSALTWLHVNHLINGLHKQISWKNYLYADNLYFTLCSWAINFLLPNLVYLLPKHKKHYGILGINGRYPLLTYS